MQNILSKIAGIILAPFILVGTLLSPTHLNESPVAENNSVVVGATLPQATGVFETSLATAINSSATSMVLTSNAVRGGGSISGYTCFTVDEGSAQAEVICGTVAGTAVSSLLRGISYADGTTEVTANKYAHRRGANVKITDFPILQILKAQNNGEATFPNLLKYETGVTPISGDDLVDKDYADNIASSGTYSNNRLIVAGTAGETIASGNVVYLKSSDARWYKADADLTSSSKNVMLGIAQGSGTVGADITSGILIKGLSTNVTGLTAGTTYYVSATAGALSSTAGVNSQILGVAKTTTSIYFDVNFNSSEFKTDDNVYTSETDQIQTTQNGTVEVGEANTTTKKNLLAQSFIPSKTKISGFKLYKLANTGTFTGTVTVSLQADTAGSPSGSNLASAIISNATYLSTGVGEFNATFSSEYSSLSVGSLYWLVITTSTSDTSNHPNLGINTAGGYANGSTKYKNTTDGWVAIATIDLYFKTLNGVNSQIISSDTTGKMPSTFYDVTKMPTPIHEQYITTTSTTIASDRKGLGSNQSGSVFYYHNGSNNVIERYERDSLTGQYLLTHNITPSGPSISPSDSASIVVLGNYIYTVTNDSTNIVVYRFSSTDLTGEQIMTVPTVPSSSYQYAWSDGIYFYVVSGNSSTTSRKWSVSGTTLSAVDTATIADMNTIFATGAGYSFMYDGSYVYGLIYTDVTNPGAINIYKFTDLYGTNTTLTAKRHGKLATTTTEVSGAVILNIDNSRMYIGNMKMVTNATVALRVDINLIPITKP